MDRESTGKRRYWEKHLKEWRESGLSQAEYCRRHDLRVYQFTYWKKRLNSGTPAGVEAVELVVGGLGFSPGGACSPIRIMVGNGRFQIEVTTGFEPSLLRQVVRILAGV